ncbi:MAG TPA: hypothetical protein VIJ77_00250 [Candidatus Tumulicola sp.]
MHDIGLILWVVIVVVGVVSSIVSNARKGAVRAPARPQPQAAPQRQAQRAAVVFGAPPAPAPVRAVSPPAAAPLPKRRPPAVRQTPVPEPAGDPFAAHDPAARKRSSPARQFAGRRSLVRAVVAAEVLGKPLALRDE